MSFASDSAPGEARKRGSGGGSPRKHDDLLTCRSDPDGQSGGAPVSGEGGSSRKENTTDRY